MSNSREGCRGCPSAEGRTRRSQSLVTLYGRGAPWAPFRPPPRHLAWSHPCLTLPRHCCIAMNEQYQSHSFSPSLNYSGLWLVYPMSSINCVRSSKFLSVVTASQLWPLNCGIVASRSTPQRAGTFQAGRPGLSGRIRRAVGGGLRRHRRCAGQARVAPDRSMI